jgi:glycosyltransferase involved in cell wall biosynthesis
MKPVSLSFQRRERKHFPLIRFCGADIEVCSNQDRWTGILHGNDPGLGFLPPQGVAGAHRAAWIMKILYFIDHLRPDGTQWVLGRLVEGLARKGHQQMVISLNRGGDEVIVDRLTQSGAEVRAFSKWSILGAYGIPRLWQEIRRRTFDVAVTFLFASDVLGRWMAHRAGIPRIVSSLRARNIDYARWQRRMVRWTMRWADAVILNSRTFQDFAIQEEGVPKERIHVIPNGIAIENLTGEVDREALRRALGIDEGVFLIGSVGRLTKQKGFDIFIQALARLGDPTVELLLVGRGEEEEKLRAQAFALGLGKRVHWGGYRQDVAQILRILDVYVQPSRFEGMPNALMEAMAAGRPVIASSVDGILDLIDDGIHGLLVPPEDGPALAEAIKALKNHPARASEMAEAAKKRIVIQFGMARILDQWEKVLTSN